MIYKISPGTTVVDGSKLKPGDSVILSGDYEVAPYFKNLIFITVTNDGPVFIKSGLKCDNCRNSKILGNRKDVFKISAPQEGRGGINIYNGSTDIEVAYLEIVNTGFAGVMCKDDGAKRGGPFVMRNIKIHHNKISKTGGEGLYIGGTNPAGHDLENVEINDNEITDTGWDGLQLGNCVSGALIHDNRITRTGKNITRIQDQVQDNGIQVGDRTKGKVYRNTIRDSGGNGLIILGSGVEAYDNKLFNCGESGIFSDSRADTTEANTFRANVILIPKMYGVHVMDTHSKNLKPLVSHNMILSPGNGYFKNGNWIDRPENNNYTDLNILLAEHLMRKP